MNRNIIFCCPVLLARSPVLRRQAMLASSCSQLEAIGSPDNQQRTSSPEFRVRPSTPLSQGAVPPSFAPPALSFLAASEPSHGPPLPHQPLYLRRRAGRSEKDGDKVRRRSEGFLRFVRSHSEPGLSSSTDTGESDSDLNTVVSYNSLIITMTITCSFM